MRKVLTLAVVFLALFLLSCAAKKVKRIDV